MAGGATSYLQKKMLDDLLGIASYTPPAVLYAALHSGNPTDAGSHASEISAVGTNYSRLAITGKTGATDATSGVSLNTATITFGPAAIDWGPVPWFSIEDSATPGAGNMLAYGPASTARVVNAGMSFQIAPSQLIINVD